MQRVLELPPQNGEVSKRRPMPTKPTATPVESLTPNNENSVLDFALAIIAIIPTTIDANASPKLTTMIDQVKKAADRGVLYSGGSHDGATASTGACSSRLSSCRVRGVHGK
jgi:hypothetical protein